MIQKVQNSCQFHGLSGDDANKYLEKFLHVTQSIKVNGVTDDALHVYLFPHSLTHHANAWFYCLPRNSFNTFEQIAKMFLGKYFPPSMVTKLINEIINFPQRPDESLFEAWERYKHSIDRCPNHNMLPITQIDTFYNGLPLRHRDTINAAAGRNFMNRRLGECYDLIKNMTAHHNDWDNSAQRSESSITITSSFDSKIVALKAKMAEINKNLMKVLQVNQQVKAVTPSCETYGGPHSYNDCPATAGQTQNVYAAGAYQGGNSYQPQGNRNLLSYRLDNYQGPPRGTTKEETNSSKELVMVKTRLLLIKHWLTKPQDLKGITTRSGTVYQRPTIPTTSSSLPKVVERETEVTKDTVPPTNNGSTKDVQSSVVQIETSIPNYEPVVAPIIEPVVAPANDQKEKFFQIFKDLDFNISFVNALILMPKFGPTIKSWLTNKDKLYELARTLLNEHCSAVLLKKLPEKLEDPRKFLIPCDIPGMNECLALADLSASINLMPLSVWNKLSLPKLTPTLMTLELVNRSISRHIGVAEDVFVKVGKFHFPDDFVVVDFDADPLVPLILERSFLKTGRALIDFASGNLTPYYDLVVSTSSPTLTPFGDSDFLLEEVDAFLALEDDPTLPEVDHSYYDTEGGILLLEAFLNDDPSLPPLIRVELKDLPPYLKYAFLEGDNKLPVIIAKDLSVEEKAALIKVLKSHKRANAWKLSDIKGINPEFFTHNILMEGDFEPAAQHQRRVNPKIYEVIKKEVLKLLDAGLIYPISDSPWVSPVHCVPKKGGFTVVENEENELIPTRLFRGGVYALTTETSTIVFSMVSRVTFKFPSILKIKKRPHLRVLVERLPTVPCLSGYVMHRDGIEVDKAKVDVIAKLPHLTTVKGIRSFLGHAGFYRRFIQDFSKIARSMTRLLEKDTPFFFSKECVAAFQTLKRKLTEAPILIALDWDLRFKLMCNACDFAIGAVLGQRHEKHFRPIHYASKTIIGAESHYTTSEKEMLAVVYAFEKFCSYRILNKRIVYTDHFALKYLFAKKDSKARRLWWILLLQEFKFKVIDTKGAENLAADHLS
nr:hypothetical protein [Tanacetum cinerariifolium]